MTQWGLDALFNPSKRHMDEEKRRLQSTREEIGDASGGRRIDPGTGKVVIRRKTAPTPPPTDGEPGEAATDEAATDETATDELEAMPTDGLTVRELPAGTDGEPREP